MATEAMSQRVTLRRTRKTVSGVTWALATLLVIAAGALGIYIHTGHGHLTPVLSGSMRPGIHEGDVVVTQRVAVTSLKVGDIIVFTPPDLQVAKVHRIATLQKVSGGKIAVTTKGDANNDADPWGKILMKGNTYRVAFTIPKMGWLMNGGLRWIVTGIAIFLGLLIARWTWQYVRSDGSDVPEGGKE